MLQYLIQLEIKLDCVFHLCCFQLVFITSKFGIEEEMSRNSSVAISVEWKKYERIIIFAVLSDCIKSL